MTVTFFGHKDTPLEIRVKLKEILADLIENQGAKHFYVGNQGSFDRISLLVLNELKEEYPFIEYHIVLAYLSDKTNETWESTLFPEGVENVPQRFAINYRNKWMIEQADTVVCYIKRSFGGAARFVEIAEKKGKTIINLSNKLLFE